MKKIVFIIVLSLLLVGCNSQYTLEIGDNKIKETLITNIPVEVTDTCESMALHECDDDSDEIVEANIYPLINNHEIEYKVTKNYTENEYINTRTFDFTYENFKDSYVLNNCFDEFSYKHEKGTIYINANGFSNCYNNSDIIVKVISKNKVYENNSDSKNGNTYIWNINEDNYSNINLTIKIQDFTLKPVINWTIVLILLLGVIWFFVRKSQKINEIK